MARQTVGEQLVGILARAGVQRVYGVVGDSLNPVIDAIRRTPGIEWLPVRHEEAAAFAAGAEAQITGRLAACAGTSGPGHVHLINGLYDAQRSAAPVVAIAAHIPSSEIGTGYFQETHPDRLFAECSHYSEAVVNPEQMPRVLQTAIQYAVGRSGVAVISLPGDIAARDTSERAIEVALVTRRPAIRPADEELTELARMIDEASRVTLFCGIGTAGAHDEVMALAERIKAPVGHALRGKEWIQYDNPYDVGMSGLLGYGAAYDAMHEADLLVLVGTDFPYSKFLPDNVPIAQIDIRPEQLGRRCKLALGVWGDARQTLQALLPLVGEKTDRQFLDRMLRKHADTLELVVAAASSADTERHNPIHPEYLAAVLDTEAAEDAIFTIDTGMCTVWAARYLSPNGRRRMIGSFSHGSMANALPQAIGAQLADRDRQVVVVCGDGGLSMLMGDLLSLIHHQLPVKVVLFNNSALALVQIEMMVAGVPPYGTDYPDTDYAAIARTAGLLGIRVEDPKNVREALREAFRHDGPALVDVVTDPNVLALPPRLTAEQVAGFALSASKMVLSGGVGRMIDMARANLPTIRPDR
jgi:pyruvate dehydrogenase (quinone)